MHGGSAVCSVLSGACSVSSWLQTVTVTDTRVEAVDERLARGCAIGLAIDYTELLCARICTLFVRKFSDTRTLGCKMTNLVAAR